MRQIFFSAFLVLPAGTVAAVTANFAQFFLALLAGYSAVLAGSLLVAQDFRWDGVAWILTTGVATSVLVISAAAILLAYIQRKIGPARSVLGAGVVFCGMLPAFNLWPVAFRIQQRLSSKPSDAASIRLSFDAARGRVLGRHLMNPTRRGFARVIIPIEVQNVPPGAELLSDRVNVAIGAGERILWRSGWRAESRILRRNDAWWLPLEIDRVVLDNLRNRDARVSARAAFTLLRPPHVTTLPFPVENRFVRDVGFCSGRGNHVICLSPFLHAASVEMGARSCRSNGIANLGIRAGISYAPYPTDFGFRLWNTDIDALQFKSIEACELMVETRQPLAHFERDLDIPSIRLASYEAR